MTIWNHFSKSQLVQPQAHLQSRFKKFQSTFRSFHSAEIIFTNNPILPLHWTHRLCLQLVPVLSHKSCEDHFFLFDTYCHIRGIRWFSPLPILFIIIYLLLSLFQVTILNRISFHRHDDATNYMSKPKLLFSSSPSLFAPKEAIFCWDAEKYCNSLKLQSPKTKACKVKIQTWLQIL